MSAAKERSVEGPLSAACADITEMPTIEVELSRTSIV